MNIACADDSTGTISPQLYSIFVNSSGNSTELVPYSGKLTSLPQTLIAMSVTPRSRNFAINLYKAA